MKAVIRHYAFPDFYLRLPFNWLEDPFNNDNWRHHLNSLRWVIGIKNSGEQKKILTNFYSFNCKKKAKNPYYSSLRGDHTAAIRMGVLIELKEKFLRERNVGGVGICKRLIAEELVNLQSEGMYREGHNHGLMVDLAILNLLVKSKIYSRKIDIELVLDRSARTLDRMWHSSGYTTEHSVSYQEFNLPLAIRYFQKLRALGLCARTNIDSMVLKDETKKY